MLAFQSRGAGVDLDRIPKAFLLGALRGQLAILRHNSLSLIALIIVIVILSRHNISIAILAVIPTA